MKTEKNIERDLAEIKELLANQAYQNDEPLTVEQVCALTGFKRSYIYKLVHFNKLSYFKPGGKKLYFSKNAVKEWLFSKKKKSNTEIAKEATSFIIKEKMI